VRYAVWKDPDFATHLKFDQIQIAGLNVGPSLEPTFFVAFYVPVIISLERYLGDQV